MPNRHPRGYRYGGGSSALGGGLLSAFSKTPKPLENPSKETGIFKEPSFFGRISNPAQAAAIRQANMEFILSQYGKEDQQKLLDEEYKKREGLARTEGEIKGNLTKEEQKLIREREKENDERDFSNRKSLAQIEHENSILAGKGILNSPDGRGRALVELDQQSTGMPRLTSRSNREIAENEGATEKALFDQSPEAKALRGIELNTKKQKAAEEYQKSLFDMKKSERDLLNMGKMEKFEDEKRGATLDYLRSGVTARENAAEGSLFKSVPKGGALQRIGGGGGEPTSGVTTNATGMVEIDNPSVEEKLRKLREKKLADQLMRDQGLIP